MSLQKVILAFFFLWNSTSLYSQTHSIKSATDLVKNLCTRTAYVQILPPDIAKKEQIKTCQSTVEFYSENLNKNTTQGASNYNKDGLCVNFWIYHETESGVFITIYFIAYNERHAITKVYMVRPETKATLDSILTEENWLLAVQKNTNPNIEWSVGNEFIYNEKGLLILHTLKDAKKSWMVFDTHYSYNLDDSLVAVVHNEYEENGTILRSHKDSFIYENNKIVKSIYYEDDREIHTMIFSYPSNEEKHQKQYSNACAEPISESTWMFNQNGQVIRESTTTLNQIQGKTHYEYNRLGQIKKIKNFEKDSITSCEKYYYTSTKLLKKRIISSPEYRITQRWVHNKNKTIAAFYYQSIRNNRLETSYKVDYFYENSK